MKNKLPFLLAIIFLGQTAPAQAFTFRDVIGFLFTTTGALKSAENYGISSIMLNSVQSPDFPLYNSGTDLDKQLHELAKTQNLDNVGFQPMESDKMSSIFGSAFDKLVIINKEDYQFMLKMVAENKDKNIFLNKDLLSSDDKENICRIEAMIFHELGHIKNRDSSANMSLESIKPALESCFVAASLPDDESKSKAAMVSGAVTGWAIGSHYPVLTSCSAIFSYLFNMAPSHQNTTSEGSQFINQVGMSAISAAGASLLVDAIHVAYGKYKETRADDSIPNDPALLHAAEKAMRNHATPVDLIFGLIDPHPTPTWRANRFRDRRLAIQMDTKKNVKTIQCASLREITAKFKPSAKLLNTAHAE